MALPQATYTAARSGLAAPDLQGALKPIFDMYADSKKDQRQAALEAENKRRWDIEQGYKQRAEQRAMDALQLTKDKEAAMNQAMMAVMKPEQYGASKMATEQAAIEESLGMLSPEDRKVAEAELKANYDPAVSRQGWLDVATSDPLVDQTELNKRMVANKTLAASTPGTPEYKAAQEAKMTELEKRLQLQSEKEVSTAEKKLGLEKEYEKEKAAEEAANLKELINVVNISPLDETGKKMGKNEYMKLLTSKMPIGAGTAGLDVITKKVQQMYPKATKEEVKAAQTKQEIADYRKLLADKGIDTTGVTTKTGLKELWDNANKKDKKTAGSGYANTTKTFIDLGIDTDHRADILEEAKKYDISDKDLATLVEAYNEDYSFIPRFSGSVKQDVIKVLKDSYQLKK